MEKCKFLHVALQLFAAKKLISKFLHRLVLRWFISSIKTLDIWETRTILEVDPAQLGSSSSSLFNSYYQLSCQDRSSRQNPQRKGLNEYLRLIVASSRAIFADKHPPPCILGSLAANTNLFPSYCQTHKSAAHIHHI